MIVGNAMREVISRTSERCRGSRSALPRSQVVPGAAAAAAAGKSACASWQSGYDTRIVASRATVNFTKDPKWTWDGITGLLNAEFAAITTEAGRLPGIIATENLAPTIKTAITDYKTKLDAYADGLRADQAARGSGDNTWVKSNPAFSALGDSASAVRRVCA